MPNHVANHVVVYTFKSGHDARKVAEYLKDFNRILPMPEEFKHIVSGGRTFPDLSNPEDYYLTEKYGHKNQAVLWWDEEGVERPITKKEYADLMDKYGCVGWYSWCNTNWGTKWGSYDCDAEPTGTARQARIRFSTAWSPPEPVLQKLADMFPGVKIVDRWRDEGGPSGCITCVADPGRFEKMIKGNHDALVHLDSVLAKLAS